jgi:hypothetical protein
MSFAFNEKDKTVITAKNILDNFMIVFRLPQKYDFYLVKDYSPAIILMHSKKG